MGRIITIFGILFFLAAGWLIAHPSDRQLRHITQQEAGARCPSGMALPEEKRPDGPGPEDTTGGAYHYYPCYGGGEIPAMQG